MLIVRRFPLPAVAAILIVVVSGCATPSASGPATAPGAVGDIGAADVPPPPASATDAVRSAWNDLRAGVVVSLPSETTITPEGQALAGFGQLRRGSTAAARASFDGALAVAPDLAVAAYGMGLVARAQGQRQVAHQWFERALENDPELARADLASRALALEGMTELLARAEAAEQSGRPEDAEGAYTEAIAMAPWVAGPYLRLAALRAVSDGPEAAIAVLQEGRRRTDDAPVVLEQLGRRYMDAERYAEASEALDRLRVLRPESPAAERLAADARRRYEMSALPAEYRDLSNRQVITREELAAVLAINLQGLQPPREPQRGVIIADLGDRWSAPFVQRMVEWGVLDIYQNNTFWPEMEVRRSMLVEAAWRVLDLVGAAQDAPALAIQEPPPEHLLYRAVQIVVARDVMRPASDGSFDLLETVSGAEVLETIRRLAGIVRERQS